MSSNMIKLLILSLAAAALGALGERHYDLDLFAEEDLSPLEDRRGQFLNYGFGDVNQAMNVKREADQPSYRVRRDTPENAAPQPAFYFFQDLNRRKRRPENLSNNRGLQSTRDAYISQAGVPLYNPYYGR